MPNIIDAVSSLADGWVHLPLESLLFFCDRIRSFSLWISSSTSSGGGPEAWLSPDALTAPAVRYPSSSSNVNGVTGPGLPNGSSRGADGLVEETEPLRGKAALVTNSRYCRNASREVDDIRYAGDLCCTGDGGCEVLWEGLGDW